MAVCFTILHHSRSIHCSVAVAVKHNCCVNHRGTCRHTDTPWMTVLVGKRLMQVQPAQQGRGKVEVTYCTDGNKPRCGAANHQRHMTSYTALKLSLLISTWTHSTVRPSQCGLLPTQAPPPHRAWNGEREPSEPSSRVSCSIAHAASAGYLMPTTARQATCSRPSLCVLALAIFRSGHDPQGVRAHP